MLPRTIIWRFFYSIHHTREWAVIIITAVVIALFSYNRTHPSVLLLTYSNPIKNTKRSCEQPRRLLTNSTDCLGSKQSRTGCIAPVFVWQRLCITPCQSFSFILAFNLHKQSLFCWACKAGKHRSPCISLLQRRICHTLHGGGYNRRRKKSQEERVQFQTLNSIRG